MFTSTNSDDGSSIPDIGGLADTLPAGDFSDLGLGAPTAPTLGEFESGGLGTLSRALWQPAAEGGGKTPHHHPR
jgi:hypothetical protein